VFDAEKVGETLMDITPGLPRTDDFQPLAAARGRNRPPRARASQDTLRQRIEGDTVLGPSSFHLHYLESYAEAARTWLHGEAEVVDTTHLTPSQAALQIAEAVKS